MKLYTHIIITVIILFLCFYYSHAQYENSTTNQQKFICTLYSTDLSEDMSTVSTHNDELIFLIYADNRNKVVPELIYQEYFVFDSLTYEKTFEFSNPCADSSELTFVLIEIDTRKTIKQIE